MARTINCDYPGCGETADYLLSVLAAGETRGFCTAHYTAACAAFVLAAGGEELDGEAATAVAALAPSSRAETVDIPPGELWTCRACGAEFPSEESIVAHVIATHPEGDAGGYDMDNGARETVEAEA